MLNMTETQFKQTIDDVISKNGIVLGLCRDVDGLKQDVCGLKQDVCGLKQDVCGLKQDVGGLKQNFAELSNEVHRRGIIQEDMQKDLKMLRNEVHRQGLIQEDMQKDLRTIVQAITPLLKKTERTEDLENKLQDHQDKIEVTQVVLRTHINDANVHKRSKPRRQDIPDEPGNR